MQVCARCGDRIGVREARVTSALRGVWCARCVYEVEERGEPVDSEASRQARAQREQRERERKAHAKRSFEAPASP